MGKQRLTMMRASIETARAYAEAEFEAAANDHSRDDNDMHRLRHLILTLNAAADFAKGLEGGE